MSKLRVGLVGCGAVSTIYHLPALRRMEDVRVTGVVDVDGAWARKVAKRFAVPFCSSNYADLCGRVEAVLIATPNATHSKIATDFLEQGIHVLCEKPLAISSADAEGMIAAANKNGARLMAGQSRRFGSNILLARQMISSGNFGAIRRLSASLGGDYRAWKARTDYRSHRELAGGGVLMDIGIHLIDMAIWFLGSAPTQVKIGRLERSLGWGMEDYAELELHFGDTCASVMCSYTRGLSATLRIDAERGWVRADLNDSSDLEFYLPDSRLCRNDGVQRAFFANGGRYGYSGMWSHFCHALRGGEPFVVTPDQVMATLRTVEFCYAAGCAPLGAE
jgi:predicted dehydrogenase